MTDTALAAPPALSKTELDHVVAVRRGARAWNTVRTYRAQWEHFATWCAGRDARPLPAAPELIALYLTRRAETARIATVRLASTAIRAAHEAAGAPDPTSSPAVRETLRAIARQHAERPDAAPRQAAPLSYDDAVALLTLARQPVRTGRGIESADAADLRGTVDAAIVALLFCAGLRRSEAAAVCWQDIEPTARAGQLRVRVRRSKTNQTGERVDHRLLVGGFSAALDALHAARPAAEPTDRVIPLSPRQINRRLQALAAVAGLDGISAHSGRRGLATELVRRGASTTAVQQAGGWQSPEMVNRYASAVAVEDGAVGRYFGS